MPLYGNPSTSRSYAHTLVVVTVATTRGESIAEPEIISRGEFIGNIGESSCALIRCYHQVGIITISAHNINRRYNFTIDKIVTDIK